MKGKKKYLERAGTKNCWFAYPHTADPRYYGIGCNQLDAWPEAEPVPEKIQGTVLISASELSGFFSGPAELNPYAEFARVAPIAEIDGSVLVYQGEFDTTLASAESHGKTALSLAENDKMGQAVAEAQQAVALAPGSPTIRAILARVLAQGQRFDEARAAYDTALSLAH